MFLTKFAILSKGCSHLNVSNGSFYNLFKKITIIFVKNHFLIFILFVSCLDNSILTTFFFLQWQFFFHFIFILLWEFFYPRDNFSFATRMFPSMWEYSFCCEIFFCHEKFSFVEIIFLFLWEFSSWKFFYPKWKCLANHIKKDLVGYVAYAY